MCYLISGGDALRYNLSMPKERQSRCCVVFVHAGDGNMLGPHRMFVELERVLNSEGYAALRFDLAGCGDSTGISEHDPLRDLGNLNDILSYLSRKTNLDDIVLLGISRGAYTALKYMQEYENNVNGAVFLSLPVTNAKVRKKTLSYRAKEYAMKLTSRKTYIKLLRNQINFKLVFRTFFQVFSKKRSYPARNTRTLNDHPVLLVYGENDPLFFDSKRIYLPLLESASSDVVCKTIEGANHSFFHYKWKEEIKEIIINWLKERF